MHRERWSEKEGAEGQERKREVDDEEDERRRLRERKRVREGERVESGRRTCALHEVWIREGSDERKPRPAYII